MFSPEQMPAQIEKIMDNCMGCNESLSYIAALKFDPRGVSFKCKSTTSGISDIFSWSSGPSQLHETLSQAMDIPVECSI